MMAAQGQGSERVERRFTHPSDWQDEQRMNFLLAPLAHSKHLPPPSDQRVQFWSSLILSSSREMKEVVFTERELADRFRWKGRSPSCLATVLEVMERKGDVRKFSEEDTDVGSSQSWVSWGVSMVAKPANWAWRSYAQQPPQSYQGMYTVTALVKELAEVVISDHQKSVSCTSTDRVMRYSEFQQLCQRVSTNEGVRSVEAQLLLDRKITKRRTDKGWEVVKFATREQRSAPEVTETDVGIVGMKETVKTLTQQVSSLERRVQQLKDSAKTKMRQKDRQGALNCLRQGKSSEKTLAKRETALSNVQQILDQIQAAETDEMVYQCYRNGVEALKKMRKAAGFNPDEAETMMTQMDELIQDNEEISQILSQGGAAHEDDDELEKELEALLAPQLQGGTGTEELEEVFAALDVGDHGSEATGTGKQLHSGGVNLYLDLPDPPTATPRPKAVGRAGASKERSMPA